MTLIISQEKRSRNIFDRVIDALGGMRVVGIRSVWWMALHRMAILSGWYRWKTPLGTWTAIRDSMISNPPAKRESTPKFLFDADAVMQAVILANQSAEELRHKLEDIRKGYFPIWGEKKHNLGFPPEWNRNLLTGLRAVSNGHWSEAAESATGDIKGIWELSRFAIVFRLARIFQATREESAAESFWTLVESWVETNPPNAGLQWFEGQEVALRALAWEFGLRAFEGARASTLPRRQMLSAALAAHAARVEESIAYARAQNNNHLISVAAGLYTIGLMHPEFPRAESWKKMGARLLGETASQFFPDGGYIQHSMNYHRLALQLVIWCCRLAERNGETLPFQLIDKLEASFVFFREMIDPETGKVPNFGHNDGSLLLNFRDESYQDYRPLAQTLSLWLRKRRAYPAGWWDEDACWMGVGLPAESSADERQDRRASFPDAGLYVLQNSTLKAYVRCAQFHSRPAHADQLNVDIWWQGENVACDAGSYSYSGPEPWMNALARTAAHNTVSIDGLDQMKRSGRFLWTTLAQGKAEEVGFEYFRGNHDGYRSTSATHHRTVRLKDSDRITVEDVLEGTGHHRVSLHWLLPDHPFHLIEQQTSTNVSGEGDWAEMLSFQMEAIAGTLRLSIGSSCRVRWNIWRAGAFFSGDEMSSIGIPGEIRGWRSPQYASKMPALSLMVTIEDALPVRFISEWQMQADR